MTPKISVSTPSRPSDAQLLDTVAHKAFAFFWNETHPQTGLTKTARATRSAARLTRTRSPPSPRRLRAGRAAVGVERRWVSREAAYRRALTTLRFVHDKLPNVHGFHYHFVDWRNGEREWKSELSSIDSTLLTLGALAAGQYFRGEAGRLANAIYARMDWPWMQRGDGKDPKIKTLSHGWKPESGWLPNRWARYDEASYLYLLAMGAPTQPIGPDAWNQWEVTMGEVEGYPVFGGPHPLFFSQMTPGYFDLRGMRDRQNRDWWTNFRNDHLANRAYCARKATRSRPMRAARGASRPATSRAATARNRRKTATTMARSLRQPLSAASRSRPIWPGKPFVRSSTPRTGRASGALRLCERLQRG
jgi:hypothetical protein